MVSARYPVRAVAFVAFYIVCASCVGGHATIGAGRPALRGSTDKSGTENSGVGFPQKRNREKFLSKTLFLGQLPFSTTKEQLQLFFARRGIGDVNIRMLTDRKTNVFRGMAFVDFQNEKDAEIALKMDHGLLGGRRIRIERTASGGGNKPKRKARIVRAKQERDTEKRKEVIAMIDRIFTRQEARTSQFANAGALLDDPNLHASRRLPVERAAQHTAGANTAASGGEMFRRQDVDDQLIDALCTLPEQIARRALKICSRLEVGSVRNRGAYAIGVIKKRLRKAERRARRKRAALRTRKENEDDEDDGEEGGLEKESISDSDDDGASSQ